MLLIQSARKRALSIPGIAVILVPVGQALTAMAIAMPGSLTDRALPGVSGVAMLLFCVLTTRVTSWDGRHVYVRSLLQRVVLDAGTCAFRIHVEGTRSPTIYLRAEGPDGTRATVAEWMAFGDGPARRKAAELERLIGTHAVPEAQSLEAQSRNAAEAQIDAYYASGTGRLTTRIFVTVFLVAMITSIAFAAYLSWSDAH